MCNKIKNIKLYYNNINLNNIQNFQHLFISINYIDNNIINETCDNYVNLWSIVMEIEKILKIHYNSIYIIFIIFNIKYFIFNLYIMIVFLTLYYSLTITITHFTIIHNSYIFIVLIFLFMIHKYNIFKKYIFKNKT